MARGYKRRNYFINQDLQGKMIFWVFLLSILGVALFTIIFSLLSADHLTISYVDQQFRVGATPTMLIMELFAANWLFILLSGVVLSVLMLFVSHSFAGPLYRLEAGFKKFNARDLNQHIQLRDRDIGQNLAAEVNLFSSLYSSDLQRLQELAGILADEIVANPSSAAQKAQSEMDKILSSYQYKTKG